MKILLISTDKPTVGEKIGNYEASIIPRKGDHLEYSQSHFIVVASPTHNIQRHDGKLNLICIFVETHDPTEP